MPPVAEPLRPSDAADLAAFLRRAAERGGDVALTSGGDFIRMPAAMALSLDVAAAVAVERTRCLAIIAREINGALRDIDEAHAAPRLIVAVGRAEKAIARGDAANGQSNEKITNGARGELAEFSNDSTDEPGGFHV